MRIDWTEIAEADLDALVLYIADESIQNALAMDVRIRERIRMLADFPDAGRLGRVFGTREMIVPHDRCVVVYQVQGDLVLVLRVIHGGQEWPLYFEPSIV
jgi:toxin ParE1/3/4